MTEAMWVRSHVERLLQDEWNVCRVEPDAEGDYPFRWGTASCWIEVLDTDPVLVRVFAHAAVDLRASAKLLAELNAIQAQALSAAIRHEGRVVIVSQTLCPWALSPPVLVQAMTAVGGLADDVGMLLAQMFGGATPYPADQPQSEDAA
jgi:hypothetical protein